MKPLNRYISAAVIVVSVLIPLTTEAAEDNNSGRLPLAELQVFAQAFEQIRSSYVEEIDDKALLEKAIVGMLAELDPHSSFLKEESFQELQEQTSGEFGGIGIEVGLAGGLIKVVSPIDDTPASRAGIRPGDLIIKLNDQSVQGMGLDQAIKIMRGEKGTSLSLTIARENSEGTLYFNLIRDIIKVRSVRHKWLEPGFGYVRIAQFQADTGDEFKKSLIELNADGKSLRGLILDLRNNPGGLLPASVEVADALIEEGLIVYTEGRAPSSSHQYAATPGDSMAGTALVVLINGGSASAAEIVAGAIQDHKRGVLLGTKSFGKGSVQNILPLDDGRAIKLTTARYFTPNGRSIQAAGIKPDIRVEKTDFRPQKTTTELGERNLEGHLEGSNEREELAVEQQIQDDTVATDNQLYEALNLLKGVAILSANI
jgi:carboxyl-terminal processing protease